LPWLPWLAWQLWLADAARMGRMAFAERLALLPGGLTLALDGLVLLGLAVHVVAGTKLVLDDVTPRSAGSHKTAGSRAWQRLTGVLALAFVVFHAVSLWATSGPVSLYATLDETLGQPRYLLIWIVGLTAIFAHVAEGLPASLRTLRAVGGENQMERVRVVAALVAAAGWLWSMNSLAHFATGAAYVGGL